MVKINASSFIQTIQHGGRTITLKYATKTDSWERIYVGSDITDKFVKAVESQGYIASCITTIIMAESEHASPADKRTHFTAEGRDEKDEHVATMHLNPSAE